MNVVSSMWPDFCPFGRVHKGGKACRGGNAAKDAAEDTAQMYKEAAECAVKGVIDGKGDFATSQAKAFICGTTKPEGKLW